MNCYFSRQLILEVNVDKKISMFHCCVLFNECIDRVPFEEYNSQKDIKLFLTEKYQTNPLNHNFHPVNSDCRGSETCDFNNGLTPNFVTVSHTCCNLNCKMCTTIKPKTKEECDSSFEEYMYVLNSIKGMGLKYLQISSAGEPFFRKERVIEYLKNLTHEDTETVGFVTNATLLSKKDISNLAKAFKKNNVKVSATVSCDGISPGTYKAIRGVDGFYRVLSNIIEFNKHGMLSEVNFVIQPDNLDELAYVVPFWKGHNIDRIRIIYPILHPEWDWMRDDPRVKNIQENFKEYYVSN